MTKIILAVLLSAIAASSFAQASAPAAAASAPKHKWLKKIKSHKPASVATDPAASPDKKGGQ
jgi:type IV secretory pathway VirB2 component (pilin)